MTYCTSGNIRFFETDVVSVQVDVHPTPVRPAVPWREVLQPDDEEGPGGVVVQRETPVFLPLVVVLCPYQVDGAHFVIILIIVIAEVLSVVLLAIFIFTSEVKPLAFHNGHSRGFDTDPSCRSGKKQDVLVA